MDYAFARRLTLPMHRQDTRVHIGPVRIHSSTDNVSEMQDLFTPFFSSLDTALRRLSQDRRVGSVRHTALSLTPAGRESLLTEKGPKPCLVHAPGGRCTPLAGAADLGTRMTHARALVEGGEAPSAGEPWLCGHKYTRTGCRARNATRTSCYSCGRNGRAGPGQD